MVTSSVCSPAVTGTAGGVKAAHFSAICDESRVSTGTPSRDRDGFRKRLLSEQPEPTMLAPPTVGKLADIDPALVVTPPKGLEAGYVPIATRQAIETK